jgi:excisionase family DNA binding protein
MAASDRSRRYLLTIAEAAEALGVSKRHVERLIHEADANRRSRWRWGRELVDLSPAASKRRTVRINLAAVVAGLSDPDRLP